MMRWFNEQPPSVRVAALLTAGMGLLAIAVLVLAFSGSERGSTSTQQPSRPSAPTFNRPQYQAPAIGRPEYQAPTPSPFERMFEEDRQRQMMQEEIRRHEECVRRAGDSRTLALFCP